MTFKMPKIISALAALAVTAALAGTASAESALVQAQSTSMPVQIYLPVHGGVDLNSNHLLKRGIANYAEGDYSTAAMLLHRSLRGNPHDGYANYYMGLTKAKIGNNRTAIKYLAKANRVFANAPNSYAALGKAYAELGQIDKAQRVLARLEKVKVCDVSCASTEDVAIARKIIKRALGQ